MFRHHGGVACSLNGPEVRWSADIAGCLLFDDGRLVTTGAHGFVVLGQSSGSVVGTSEATPSCAPAPTGTGYWYS